MTKYFVHRIQDRKILRYFKDFKQAVTFLEKIRLTFILVEFALGRIENGKTEFEIKET